MLMVGMALSAFAKSPVSLKGKRFPSKRAPGMELSIKAFWEESRNELSLEFTENAGTCHVMVSDPQGNTIYEGNIPTIEGVPVIIPVLEEGTEGTFTLSISNEEIELTGFFIINNKL